MILHHSPEKFNRTIIKAAVGKGPTRETPFGVSIDVVRIDGSNRLWFDLIPTNPEIISALRRGTIIEVSDLEVIRHGKRPIWRGKVRLAEG